jgi:phosphoserine phosphatase
MKEKVCKFYCYKNTREKNKSTTKKIDKLELVIFDMDGVLTDIISSWKYIHDYFNTSNERSVDDYLKGKIDDMEFIRRDASLWVENGKPVTREKLVEILSDVPLMKGAKECVGYLKNHNVKTAIVSAGLDILAKRVAKDLGIDYVYSNGVKTDDEGRLNGVGILEVRLMHKDEAVSKLSKQLKIPLEKTASVGNSCFDIPMFEISGLSIAFNPEDDCIQESADVIVKGKNLTKILPHIKNYIKY